MEVFSSALITYSSALSHSQSQVRAYRSRTRSAFERKAGPAMKIQDWYCQGLSASCLSQRRTVEAEIAPAMARATTSRASPGAAQRESGVPLSAGSCQARALTWAL